MPGSTVGICLRLDIGWYRCSCCDSCPCAHIYRTRRRTCWSHISYSSQTQRVKSRRQLKTPLYGKCWEELSYLTQRYHPIQEARFEQPVLIIGFQASSWAIVISRLLMSDSQVSDNPSWYVLASAGETKSSALWNWIASRIESIRCNKTICRDISRLWNCHTALFFLHCMESRAGRGSGSTCRRSTSSWSRV